MRIDRITLENFRLFPRREFAFHPQVNLLVGANGSGKTSVLDALAVAAGAWLLGLRTPEKRHIRAAEIRIQPVAARNGANGHGQRFTWEAQYPCSVEASGEVMGRALEWRRSLNSREGRTTSVDAREIKEAGALADRSVRTGDDVTLPLVSYYGTGRLWNEPRRVRSEKPLAGKESRSRLAGYEACLDPRVSSEALVRWIANQSWIAYREGSIPAAFAAARSAILTCLDGARDLYFDPKRGEVIVEFEQHGPQPFNNLSDGQRTMLALVGDIARRTATLNPGLDDRVLTETPGIVLIDELDLHLHPVWQRRVIENLRTAFPQIQFFATTHSPFLIQSLRSGEELVMLEGLPSAQLGNKTIADIAQGIMGVDPEVSARYGEMKQSATRYLEELERAAKSPREKLGDFEARLAAAVAPYADNPAFQAFLEMKRAAKIGPRE